MLSLEADAEKKVIGFITISLILLVVEVVSVPLSFKTNLIQSNPSAMKALTSLHTRTSTKE